MFGSIQAYQQARNFPVYIYNVRIQAYQREFPEGKTLVLSLLPLFAISKSGPIIALERRTWSLQLEA